MQDIVAERAFYDKLFSENPDNEHIVEGYDELYSIAFPDVPRGPVFDLGCGTGGHAIRLAQRGYAVVGVELTRAGIRATRERFRRAGLTGRFVVADVQNLPFPDGAADVAWTSLLLHHFPRLDRLPEELARVTKRQLIAFEPNAKNVLSWFAFNVINPIWGLSSTTKNQRALWPDPLVVRFKEAGFGQAALHYVHRPWRDGVGVFAVVRRVFDGVLSLLPLPYRANKFLMVLARRPQ